MLLPLEQTGTFDLLAVAAPFVIALIIQVAQLWSLQATAERTNTVLEGALKEAGNPPIIDDLAPRKGIDSILAWASDAMSVFTGILVPGIGVLLLVGRNLSPIAAMLILGFLIAASIGLFQAIRSVFHPSRYLTLFYRWPVFKHLPRWATPIWAASMLVTVIVGVASVVIAYGQSS